MAVNIPHAYLALFLIIFTLDCGCYNNSNNKQTLFTGDNATLKNHRVITQKASVSILLFLLVLLVHLLLHTCKWEIHYQYTT